MKKIFATIALVLLSAGAFAQENRVYAELLGTATNLLGLNSNVKVAVDMGQHNSKFKNYTLQDEQGKDIKFNSMVDAMNYMGKRGWKFVQAYTVGEGQSSVYHWLLYKDIQEDSQIWDGLHVKNVNGIEVKSYTLTFFRKKKTSTSWDQVKMETKKGTTDEINKIVDDWKNQESDIYDYDVKISK